MLGMLREIIALRRRQKLMGIEAADLHQNVPFPAKVQFHWACRGMAEFALLDNSFLEAYR